MPRYSRLGCVYSFNVYHKFPATAAASNEQHSIAAARIRNDYVGLDCSMCDDGATLRRWERDACVKLCVALYVLCRHCLCVCPILIDFSPCVCVLMTKLNAVRRHNRAWTLVAFANICVDVCTWLYMRGTCDDGNSSRACICTHCAPIGTVPLRIMRTIYHAHMLTQ